MNYLKIPPHSLQAEQSVLGSILIKNESYDYIGNLITENDFYVLSHKAIFRVMATMASNNKVIDLLTLTDKLESMDLLEQSGGFAYIGELAKNTPSAANIETYAGIVKEKAIYRALAAAGHEISNSGYDSQGLTGIEAVGAAEALLSKVSDNLIGNEKLTDSESIINDLLARMSEQVDSGNELLGLTTGIKGLNEKLLGLQKADLVVLAARPSMGKTAKMLNMVAANLDKNNIIFSVEMPSEKIMARLCANVGNVPLHEIKTGHISDYKWGLLSNAIQIIKESNLEIIDNGSMTVSQMRIHCRRYEKKYGKLDMISLDYLQLLKSDNKENRTQEISEISRGLKQLAKEFNCPVVALSQLNRGLEARSDKRPINSDLRESGQIEQDADVIMFLYRDEVYNENSTDKGLAEIIIGKARDGELGMVGAIWQGQYQKFTSLNGQELTSHIKPAEPKRYKKEFKIM